MGIKTRRNLRRFQKYTLTLVKNAHKKAISEKWVTSLHGGQNFIIGKILLGVFCQ
jgi:hypothetical protein